MHEKKPKNDVEILIFFNENNFWNFYSLLNLERLVDLGNNSAKDTAIPISGLETVVD